MEIKSTTVQSTTSNGANLETATAAMVIDTTTRFDQTIDKTTTADATVFHKPILILDLDLTLVHVESTPELARYLLLNHTDAKNRELQIIPVDVGMMGVRNLFLRAYYPPATTGRSALSQAADGGLWIVCLRPSVRECLQSCRDKWDCVLFTQGHRAYAQIMLDEFLDPDHSVFGGRMVAQEDMAGDGHKQIRRALELFSYSRKGIEQKHNSTCEVIIVDDNALIWESSQAKHILHALPFLPLDMDAQGKAPRPVSARASEIVASWNTRTAEDRVLASLLDTLDDLHQDLMNVRDKRVQRKAEYDAVDMSLVLRLHRARTLEDTCLCFLQCGTAVRQWASAFLPWNTTLENAAEALGSTVVRLSDTSNVCKVTHALACPQITADADALLADCLVMDQYEVPVIHLAWLLVAYAHVTWPREEHFPVRLPSADAPHDRIPDIGSYDPRSVVPDAITPTSLSSPSSVSSTSTTTTDDMTVHSPLSSVTYDTAREPTTLKDLYEMCRFAPLTGKNGTTVDEMDCDDVHTDAHCDDVHTDAHYDELHTNAHGDHDS